MSKNKYINIASINKTVKFMKSAGITSCFLFGGSTTINKTKKGYEVSDYDISVASIQEYNHGIQTLKQNGWLVHPKGDNALSRNAAVIFPPLTQSVNDEYDFQYNKSVKDKCIFNLESFYITFKRENDTYHYRFIDTHNSLKDFDIGKLRILPDRESEDEYNVLKRFLVLTGKYDLPLKRNGINQDIIDYMDARFNIPKVSTPDHLEAKGACLDKFLKVVQRAKDSSSFLFSIAQSKILKIAFPAIHNVVESPFFHKTLREQNDYSPIKLIEAMYANSENKPAILKELSAMKHRAKAKIPAEILVFLSTHETINDCRRSIFEIKKASGGKI